VAQVISDYLIDVGKGNCRILLCDFFGGSAVQERSYNGIQSDPRAAQPYYAVGSLNERYASLVSVSGIDSSFKTNPGPPFWASWEPAPLVRTVDSGAGSHRAEPEKSASIRLATRLRI